MSHWFAGSPKMPRQVLITNGQQTLGVALPWGIAASIVRPAEKILSRSPAMAASSTWTLMAPPVDGGFGKVGLGGIA